MTKTYNDIEAVTRLLEEVSTALGMCCTSTYKGWNFNSGNYLFTTDTK